MKKFIQFTAFIALALSFLMVSCDKDDDIVPLRAPENLSYTDATYNSSTLSWNAVSGAEGYALTLNDGEEIRVKETTYNAKDLAPETAYLWRVLAIKGDIRSEWSEAATFATKAAPVVSEDLPVPTGAYHGDVSYSNATLYWKAVTGAKAYDVRIVKDALTKAVDGEGTYHVEGTEFIVTGLEPSTTYKWQVRTKTDAELSLWSDALTFQTSDAPANPIAAPDAASMKVVGESVTSTSAKLE